MTERPILFTGPMVQALCRAQDPKTKTRRLLKTQPLDVLPCTGDLAGKAWVCLLQRDPNQGTMFRCRYGVPGDRLWVRETWATLKEYDHLAPSAIPIYDRPPATYFASWTGAARESPHRGKWRPSIHMPRWAAQVQIELVTARVERLQDITDEDAKAEGVTLPANTTTLYEGIYVDAFARLWDSINAARGFGWASNPWVWVLEVKKVVGPTC